MGANDEVSTVIRSNSIARTVFLAAIAAAAGCASAAPREKSATPPQTYNDCIFARTLTDWRPLDRQNLILFAGGHRAYHVVLAIPAMSLDFSVMIGVYDRDGRICPFGGDSIIIDGIMPERISIRSIKRLTDAELAELYVQYGVSKPKVVETTPLPLEDGGSQ